MAPYCNFSFSLSSGLSAITVVPVLVDGVVNSKAECAVPVGEPGIENLECECMPVRGDTGAVFHPPVPSVFVSFRVNGVSKSKPVMESRVSRGEVGIGREAMEWFRKALWLLSSRARWLA